VVFCVVLAGTQRTEVRISGSERMQTDLQSKSREDHMKTTTALKTALFAAAAFGALAAAPAQAASHSVGACLITKTDTNPFFVKMKEGAEAKAAGTRRVAEVLCGQDRRRP
jgi:threonine aldolase